MSDIPTPYANRTATELVLATRNAGKVREIHDLLAGIPVTVRSLADFPEVGEIAETGSTFEENAAIKARAVAAATGRMALADDSGLVVDALDGAPGVYSSRFAGPNANDADRNAKVLALLEGIPEARRSARFVAAIAIVTPDGRLFAAAGTCEGRIATAPQGEQGFGYDPIFFVPELGRTMAQLSPEEKNRISHRARALMQARELLQSLLADSGA